MSHSRLLVIPEYHAGDVQTIIEDTYGRDGWARENGQCVMEEGPYTFFVFKTETELEKKLFNFMTAKISLDMSTEIENDEMWVWTYSAEMSY